MVHKRDVKVHSIPSFQAAKEDIGKLLGTKRSASTCMDEQHPLHLADRLLLPNHTRTCDRQIGISQKLRCNDGRKVTLG